MNDLLRMILRCLSDVESNIIHEEGKTHRMVAYCSDILEDVYNKENTEEEAIKALEKMRSINWNELQLDKYFEGLPERIRPKA